MRDVLSGVRSFMSKRDFLIIQQKGFGILEFGILKGLAWV